MGVAPARKAPDSSLHLTPEIERAAGRTWESEEGPVPQGFQLADVGAGSYNAVVSILAAVVHRDRTGEGQYIDVSMTDAAFTLNTLNGGGYLVGR